MEPLKQDGARTSSAHDRRQGVGGASETDIAGMTNADLVKSLSDVTYQEETQVSFLHMAAMSTNTADFQALIEEHADYVNALDTMDRTPIYFAVLANLPKNCKLLINAGAHVDVQDADGRTPGHWATYHGRPECLDIILSHGDTCDVRDKDGRTMVHWATAQKQSKCLQLVLKQAGLDVDMRDAEDMTPLHWACFHNHPKHVQLLLNAKADASAVDIEGKNALHWTSGNKDASCAKILLASNADLANERDSEGRTPLHLCVGDSAKDVAQAILKSSRTDPTLTDSTGRTALHWAVALANATMIGVLVRNKDALSVQDEQGATPLHYTAQLDNDECSKALLKGIPKGKVDVVDREARTALFWAIAKEHFKTAELLLKAGANPNHVDTTGRTIMHISALSGTLEAVKLLLKYKADKEIKDKANQTALFIACENGNKDTVAFLLENGAEPSIIDSEGRTIVHAASISGNKDVLALCLKHRRGDLNNADQRGETPLHYAAYFGQFDCVQELLSSGAEPNVFDLEGITPLHWASSQGFPDVLRELLKYNAYPNYTDASEEQLTPMDYALSGGFQECVDLLEEARGATGEEVRHFAATTIQDGFRVLKAKKELQRLREEKAATVVQSAARGYLQRRRFEKLRDKKEKQQQLSEEEREAAKQREEEARRKAQEAKEQEERRKREEEERQRKMRAQEEAERKRKQKQAEKRRKEEERKRKKQEEEELKRKQEEELKRSQSLQIQKEEQKRREEKRRLEEEAKRKREEELQRLQAERRASARLRNALESQQQRQSVVRQEQGRLQLLRRKIHAATVIQRWYRQNVARRRREEGYPTGKTPIHSPTQARSKPQSPHLGKKKRRGRGGQTKAGQRSPRQQQAPLLTQTRDVDRRRLVAALTIQLWWRRYLARKYASKRQRMTLKLHGPDVVNRQQAKRMTAVYQTQRRRARVPQFKAKPSRPVRTHLLPTQPSPVDLSWASAATSYFRPPQQGRRGPRGFNATRRRAVQPRGAPPQDPERLLSLPIINSTGRRSQGHHDLRPTRDRSHVHLPRVTHH